jgi:hypothetical protein
MLGLVRLMSYLLKRRLLGIAAIVLPRKGIGSTVATNAIDLRPGFRACRCATTPQALAGYYDGLSCAGTK